MRIFIILLLVTNLLYALFNYFIIESNKGTAEVVRKRDSGNHSLILLSELENNQLRELTVIPDSTSAQNSNRTLVECMKIIGEWDVNSLLAVKQKLAANGVTVLADGKERKKKVNYWVVIPPFASRQEAITAKRQLNNEKILDTFIIKSGARENAVSLGLYSTEESAARRAEFVNRKRLGIANANIEELTLYVDRYWIKVGLGDAEQETTSSIIGSAIIETKRELCEIDR